MLHFGVIVIFAVLSVIECNEPHCTKFRYDEQLLEKMVRMEFKVELLTKEIMTTQKTVQKELISLREDREKMKLDFTTLKNEQEQKLTSQTGTFENTYAQQEAKIIRISQDIQNLVNDTLTALKDQAVIPNVAFTARNVADSSPGKNQIIIFNTNILNEGQGYNNATGVFTAPYDGMYTFTVQFCTSTTLIYYAIVVAGQHQTVAYMGDKDFTTCHSSSIVVIMEKGMDALVKCTSGSSSSTRLYENVSYYWNTFSGALIHR